MRSLQQLVRPNIKQLEAYSSARDEYKGSEGIFLDANENPFGNLNRYPDPQQRALKDKLSLLRQLPAESIFIGNGSDEVIDLCYRIFCRPGIDKALTFSPTYGMYEVAAAINDVTLVKLPLNKNFQPDLKTLQPYLEDDTVKLLFICSPNNPTGNVLTGIKDIIKSFTGIVVIDEAYIDFAATGSLVTKLNDYPNLIISQTMSKARGLAAARIGIAYSSCAIINLFNKIKPPYNVSTLNQAAALRALEDEENYLRQISLLISERERMASALLQIKTVLKVYPSDANFLLVEVCDADQLYRQLVDARIITRNRGSVVKNCIRITIGSPEENDRLLKTLETIADNYQPNKDEESTVY